MTISILKDFFMWGSILNYCLLLFSFILYVSFRKFMLSFIKSFTKLSDEKIEYIYFITLSYLKITTIVFFIVPFFAILIIS